MTTHTPAPAQQALLTDDEIRSIWVEHGLDDEAAEDFARAIESALLSKLRAPVADEHDEPTAPDDDAIAECWVNASDIDGIAYDGPSFERGYRAALASARVAGEAIPTDAEVMKVYAETVAEFADGRGFNAGTVAFARAMLRRYAASQASEAVRDLQGDRNDE